MPKENPNTRYDQLLTGAKAARLASEREAWLNVAFYNNQQYVEWHKPKDGEGYVRTIPREDGVDLPRMIINKIMHFVRTAQADALQERPTGDVLPASPDLMDRSDAAVARAWIEDQSDPLKTNYDVRLGRAAWWALLGGNGYLKWVRDESGAMIVAPSFFEVYLDPYAKTFDDARYLIHSQFMDPEQVYDIYGVRVEPGETADADEIKTELLRGMGSAPVINGVVVNELWYKPCRRYKRGHYVVWTGRQQLVEPDDLPYPHLYADGNRLIPWTVIQAIERGDTPYAASPVTYLRPPQMELNAYHNQLLVARKNFANFKWWLPEGIELDEDPDDSGNQILRGHAMNPGDKPEIIQGQAFPNNSDGEMLEQGMMHVVGQREVSNAQVPGRVEAAKAIEMLREADADALALMRKTIQASNSIGWWHEIMLARTFQKRADIVRAYSKDGVPEVKHFLARKMTPGFRIRTTQTTNLARSRANRQDLILQLWQAGILTNPERTAELLDMPMEMLAPGAEDIMLARNENLTLLNGEAVDPNSWHNHTAHLREHNACRNTTEYLTSSKEVKERFEMHCDRHEAMEEIMLARQAKLAMIAGGQPPQPGQEQPQQPPPGGAPTPQP